LDKAKRSSSSLHESSSARIAEMVNAIINTSMRENYNTFGVEDYYKNHVQESCEPDVLFALNRVD